MMKGMEESGNGHLMQQQQQQLQLHLQGGNANPSLSISSFQQQQQLQLQLQSHLNSAQSGGHYRQLPAGAAGVDAGKRSGIPPTSPYSQFPSSASRSPPQHPVAAGNGGGGGGGGGHLHSRSLSQPAFFSLDSLPVFNPSLYRASGESTSPTTSLSDSADVAMDEHDATSCRSPPLPPKNAGFAGGSGSARDGLPPRKAHRRSQSDIPFAFFQSSPPLAAAAAAATPFPFQQQNRGMGFLNASAKPPVQGVKLENGWERGLDGGGGGAATGDGVNGDDLFNAYMNLDGFEALNSSEDNRDNSRDSGSKTNGADSSENEADSNGNGIGLWANHHQMMEKKEGLKRSAAGGDNAQMTMGGPRHCRSLSMDSFIGKLNFTDESQKLLPSPGLLSGQASKGNSLDGGPNSFSLEFGNGEFTPAEMKKIMANDKLVEMAMADPKRVKRILANRQSAARSKERKMRYIGELEHKVQALQTEATTLSAQLTLLQRDSLGLTNQNNELKFRLQSMEQQAQLRDALNEALTAEVQRLKLAASGLADSHPSSNNSSQQGSINSQMFQLQQKQQSSQMPLYQLNKQLDDTSKDSGSEQ